MSDKTGKKQSAGSAEFTLPPRIATKSRKKNHEPSPVVRNIPYFSNLLGMKTGERLNASSSGVAY
jgi:hypothetical protein